MPAPELAQELLVQYISRLSNSKGYTTLAMWKDKIHEIGVSISAIDGFYKEYNKSLVCLSELKLNTVKSSFRMSFHKEFLSIHHIFEAVWMSNETIG